MKLASHFNDFLTNTVNLNETRIKQLEDSISAIKTAINSSEWTPKILSWMAQGSWAHQTIIKPIDFGEYDADLLVFIEQVSEWPPSRYIDSLYSELCKNATYGDKVRRSSHCVTITYANDRKIDIAPCIVNRENIKGFEVCNRNSDEFERSDPVKYTDWLVQQNKYAGNNSFRKITRLIKYLRDIKKTFTCPSVLLTTILGRQILSVDKDSDQFADTPTALKTIFDRMNSWCQNNHSKPSVTNPFMGSEDFSSLWTESQYLNFRSMVENYNEWIVEAFDEPDRNASISKWRRVFGDEFAAGIEAEDVSSLSKASAEKLTETIGRFTGDIVDAVKQYGSHVLSNSFHVRPYMQAPRWKRAQSGNINIRVKASLYRSKGTGMIKNVAELEPLPKGSWVEFAAVLTNGLPPSPTDYSVKWRITNTDVVAYRAKALRGGFYDSQGGQTRFEHLEYRGIHFAEAFVIRKRDDALVAQSSPFRILIE